MQHRNHKESRWKLGTITAENEIKHTLTLRTHKQVN